MLIVMTAPAFSLQAAQKPSQTNRGATASSASKAAVPGKSSSEKASIHHWKNYCSEEAEYCISYPPDWDVVGDVMEGNGVVMAPPQNGKEKDLWDDVTVSVTDLPESEGQQPPSFDDVVSVALNGLPGNNVETLQRSQLTLHDRDAELIKVRYDDKETNRPWVEEIVFIDDQLAIYSIALRATPDDVAGLEETFRRIVATWRPSEAETPEKKQPVKPKRPGTKPPGQ